MKTQMSRDDIDAEKRALRALLDSFHVEEETLLEETLNDPHTRRKIGTVIGHTMVKPYWANIRFAHWCAKAAQSSHR